MILTNSQYEQLMSKYYDKQLKTKHISEERYQEVLSAIPAIRDLDENIRQMSLSHAKASLTHGKQTENLQEKINAVTKSEAKRS